MSSSFPQDQSQTKMSKPMNDQNSPVNKREDGKREEKGYKPRPSQNEPEKSTGGYKPRAEKPSSTSQPKPPPKQT